MIGYIQILNDLTGEPSKTEEKRVVDRFSFQFIPSLPYYQEWFHRGELWHNHVSYTYYTPTIKSTRVIVTKYMSSCAIGFSGRSGPDQV